MDGYVRESAVDSVNNFMGIFEEENDEEAEFWQPADEVDQFEDVDVDDEEDNLSFNNPYKPYVE